MRKYFSSRVANLSSLDKMSLIAICPNEKLILLIFPVSSKISITSSMNWRFFVKVNRIGIERAMNSLLTLIIFKSLSFLRRVAFPYFINLLKASNPSFVKMETSILDLFCSKSVISF